MKMKEKRPLTFLIATVLLIVGFTPAFAEVTSLETDYSFYGKGDQIRFSGTVEEDSTGLVTIVIRNPADKFVLLAQAIINSDNTFERIVETEPKITVEGTYNATAFIINMTVGSPTSFDYTLSKIPNSIPETETNNEQVIVSEPLGPSISSNIESEINNVENSSESKLADFVDPTKDPQYYIDRYNNEVVYKEWFDNNYPNLTIEEAVGYELPKLADFVDPTKDPQYYIDRYNNEVVYKEWFDNNYPNLTIEEAVGYEKISIIIETQESELELSTKEIISTEIIPTAQASTIVESTMLDFENKSELTSMLLALGGLAVLFGAVYGIKLKVDNNTERISNNRETIKKKLLGNILHHDPLDVIRDRLAKGEISVDEYIQVKNALKKE